MDVEVIKLGGNVLKTENDRYKCYEKIDFSNGLKKIIVCSAMGRSGFPYSTDNLEKMAINISEKEKERLLSCGEIISSLVMSSFLNSLNIKAYCLSYLELGLFVKKNNNKLDDFFIERTKMFDLLNEYDVLIAPGFIGYDKDKEIVTLGRGNSDLTAVLLTDFFKIKKARLFKDVEGVYPFLLSPMKNYMYYENLSYDEMNEMIYSGCKVISKDANEFAKKHNLEIEISSYELQNKGTLINNKKIDKKAIGFFVKEKMIDIVTYYPCLIKDEMNDLFKKNHLIVKKEFIEGNHYYFKLESSQMLLSKKLIVNTLFENFVKKI